MDRSTRDAKLARSVQLAEELDVRLDGRMDPTVDAARSPRTDSVVRPTVIQCQQAIS